MNNNTPEASRTQTAILQKSHFFNTNNQKTLKLQSQNQISPIKTSSTSIINNPNRKTKTRQGIVRTHQQNVFGHQKLQKMQKEAPNTHETGARNEFPLSFCGKAASKGTKGTPKTHKTIETRTQIRGKSLSPLILANESYTRCKIPIKPKTNHDRSPRQLLYSIPSWDAVC